MQIAFTLQLVAKLKDLEKLPRQTKRLPTTLFNPPSALWAIGLQNCLQNNTDNQNGTRSFASVVIFGENNPILHRICSTETARVKKFRVKFLFYRLTSAHFFCKNSSMQYANGRYNLKKTIAILLVALLVCVAVVATACDKKDNVVRVNEVTHSLFYMPQYLAMALGYFEEEGLEVEVTNGNGADNVMTALLTGEADIGLMGCEANIYVYLQGKKDYPKVIGQLTKRDGSFLVARTDTENFDYSNIEGSTVLMGRKGGMPAMILQYVLNNKGYTDGVNITMDYSIQFGALGPAFTGGTGDFVPLFEPAASQLVQEGKGYIVSAIGMDSGEIPYTCYTATAEFLKDNSEKVEKFLRAVWRGTEYALSHSAEDCARLVAPYFEGTTLELLTTAIQNYQDFDVWTVTPVTDREAFSRIQDIMENAGELSQRVDYEKIVDNTCANKISPVK